MLHRSCGFPYALIIVIAACSSQSPVASSESSSPRPDAPPTPPPHQPPSPPPPSPPPEDCHRPLDIPSGWALDRAYGTHCPIYTVAAVSPTDVWIGGGGGWLYHWNGSEFQRHWAGSDVNLSHLWASGPDDVWAGGPFGALLHFDGTQWRQIDSPIRGHVLALAGSGPDDVWVLESARSVWNQPGNEHLEIETQVWQWSGRGWSLHAGMSHAASLAVVGPKDVWVGASSDDNRAVLFHWNGDAWTTWETGARGSVNSLAALATNEVWAQVFDFDKPAASMVHGVTFTLYRFDGSGWVAQPYPDPRSDGSGLSDVHGAWGGNAGLSTLKSVHGKLWLRSSFDQQGTYWDGGTIAFLRRDGDAWKRIATIDVDSSWVVWDPIEPDRDWPDSDADGSAPDDIWITGLNGELFHWNGSKLESTRLWKLHPIDAIWEDPSGDTAWAVGHLGTILRRDASGWSEKKDGVPDSRDHYSWVTGSGEADIWAGGFRVSTIHWDGTSWTPVPLQTDCVPYAAAPGEVFFCGRDGGLWHLKQGQLLEEIGAGTRIISVFGAPAAGVWAEDAMGHLFHLDGQWHPIETPASFSGFQVTQNGSVLALSAGKGVYAFDGQAWQLVTSNHLLNGWLFVAISPSDIWSTVRNPETWRTDLIHFDGKAWTGTGAVFRTDRGEVAMRQLAGSRHVWALDPSVGGSGAIYRTPP
jgi:hypothetical protein